MLHRFFRSKRGQNTAEYALLIALVVAGVIAMQTYAQRSLQARVRDTGRYLTTATNELGNSIQYEPYYLQSNYESTRDSFENKQLGKAVVAQYSNSLRTRGQDGQQQSTYDNTLVGVQNGI